MNGRVQIWISLACLAFTIGGCSTATTGTSQTIRVGSTPEGATCTLTRQDETLGKVTTPGPITVKRSEAPINVLCTKEGHEDARAVLNSQTRTSPVYGGLGVVGLALNAAAVVDMASGANIHYQTALMLDLPAMSPADQAAAAQAAARPKTPPAPSVPTAVPPPSATGPYDGEYEGDVELVQRVSANNFRRYTRHIEVRVVGGVGKGTVKHPLCAQPGDLDFTIDAAGHVKGTANTVNTDGCVPHKATLEGRVDGKDIRLAVTRERFEGWSTDFSLVRKTSSQTSEGEPRTRSRN